MEILGDIGHILSAVASIIIAFLVYRFTRQQAALQLSHEMRSAWMQIDQIALNNPEVLAMQAKFFFGEFKGDESFERWNALLTLNPIVMTWHMGVIGVAHKDSVRSAQDMTKRLLLNSEIIRRLVFETDTYEDAFKKWCQEALDQP